MSNKAIEIGSGLVKKVKIGKNLPLVFIGGPCAIESRSHADKMANEISEICLRLDIPWIFKSCYDKDCRSSLNSFHGVGVDDGLNILSDIRKDYKVPVTSDFSDPAWAKPTGEVCDLVQVPAYLCRQTSILKAAAFTGKPIHLKKGQFMSPWNMKNSVRKIESFGNNQILLTDRGTFMGYNMLVNDMRCLPIMSETGYPVCFDATHSIQLPTSMGDISGGQREYIPCLVRAAAGCGINALFMEVHDDPDNALSDANTVLDLKYLECVLSQAKRVHELRLDLLKEFGEDNVHKEEANCF
ncbi:MAG: 3-deoxy-8-phosphooctulonate synthase [Legionellales bacterium]|nr:3-deoxy-8-phosphooctulonate synthase [Legionellales bacterium]